MGKTPKDPPQSRPAMDAIVVELIDKVDWLAKRQDDLEAAKEAFTEGLAGRLLSIETKLATLEALLVSEHTGAPDLLARKVLAGFLTLLGLQWREFTTGRQTIAKKVMAIGKPLMTEPGRLAGNVEKQVTVKELENAT